MSSNFFALYYYEIQAGDTITSICTNTHTYLFNWKLSFYLGFMANQVWMKVRTKASNAAKKAMIAHGVLK